MPKLVFVALVFICLIQGCEKSTVTAENEDLALSRIPCRYHAHEHVSYQCYVARRQNGPKHNYYVSILSLKQVQNSEDASNEKANEALLAIPGGPGQGEQTKDAWIESWADFLVKNAIPYDLIVFDPPGTIGSDSFWRCEKYEHAVLQLAAKNVSFREESEFLAPILDTCMDRYHEQLVANNFSSEGVRGFSSRTYVERLALLMGALEYEAYHLLATSYGTRVAMLLAGDPQVATLTLDSVYPFSRGTLLDTPALLETAERIHRRHYAEFIHDGSTYDEVMSAGLEELELRPQSWQLERWDGLGDVNFILNASRLNDVAFSVLYDESMLEYFYAGLSNLKARPDELRWVLEDFVTTTYDPAFSTLTFVATECSDNRRVSFDELLDEAEKHPKVQEDWQLIYQHDACAHPLFTEVNHLNEESYIDKPTLVFAGELDPVTPTFWVEELLSQLPQVQVLTVANVGHAVLGSERCKVSDLIHFWQSRDEQVEVRCE